MDQHQPSPGDTPENPRSFDGRPMTTDESIRRFDALGVLTHEIAGLLDGSMRCLSMAMATLDSHSNEPLDKAHCQLNIVAGALDRMADLVGGAMQSPSAGSVAMGIGARISLAEAIEHAARVVDAWSREQGVEVRLHIEPGLESAPAGPLYVVALNAIRNAAEAIIHHGVSGVVRVSASVTTDHPRSLRLVVEDDGPGLPAHLPADALFAHGVSAKEQGSGLGLAIARHIIAQLGGTIKLTPGRGGLGAILTARCPMPQVASDVLIGRDDASDTSPGP